MNTKCIYAYDFQLRLVCVCVCVCALSPSTHAYTPAAGGVAEHEQRFGAMCVCVGWFGELKL